VVLLPGDRDTLMAAEIAAQAAAGAGLDVHVVPARTTVQSLAALAVLDPGRSVHANVVAMTSAAVATRHGAVSVATKEALTWAGVCHPGDVLGIVDGDVAFLGTDVAVAARDVLDRLLSAGGELVTLVVGADAEPGLGDGVAAALEHDRPELEVVVIDGGQPVYPLLVGVE
jgi:dihydroxyacetone kinase-like predicted kinase